MADIRAYLRFPDRKELFGSSKFRPSEGWIDLVNYRLSSEQISTNRGSRQISAAQKPSQETLIVFIATNQRVATELLQAAMDLRQLGKMVLEIRTDERWFRCTMSDSIVSRMVQSSGALLEIRLTGLEPIYQYGWVAKKSGSRK